MNLIRLWFLTIIKPKKAFIELQKRSAPQWGLYAILIRFVVTALTSILFLYLLDKKPFHPSYLTFLSDDEYYKYEIFFLPVFGLAGWLLSGNVIYLILKLCKIECSTDRILNVIGWGLLVVMPVVWLLDWINLLTDNYNMTVTTIIHLFISFWEVTLFAIGFRRIIRINTLLSLILGLIVKFGIFIPLAMIFVR
ncbi:MAG: YIP1 family protein [Patescibacteria group bacterium]|nr:YIP1 family protein [Patescibacteria group bacterium]